MSNRGQSAAGGGGSLLTALQHPPPVTRTVAVAAFIFIFVFLAYLFVFPNPRVGGDQEQKHFVFLAESFLHGSVDVPNIPNWYEDVIVSDGGKKVVYAPPAPAFLLMPAVAIWGTGFSQAHFSMLLGAANVVLFWIVLRILGTRKSTQILLIPFFAFGTVHFSAAAIGSTWFYAHVVVVFFLLLAIISLLRFRWSFLAGMFLGLAFLTREQTVLAAPFFLLWLWREGQRPAISIPLFCVGLAPCVAFALWYNYARFGGIFETGYEQIRALYLGVLPYSFYRNAFPDAPHFNLFDLRNVPLHLYTMFLMPPEYHPDLSILRPSPYGLAIPLTSPAFVYAFLVKRKTALKPLCWLAIALVATPIMLYWAQGWVQFGYRFLLDYMPFLLILTALGFEDTASVRMKTFLVVISIVANLWGMYWISQYGWGH